MSAGPPAWRHPAELPQGRKAARVGGLWRVRGGSLRVRSAGVGVGGGVRVPAVSTALYRRYRPETFAEVIGQEHVTGPLQQALRQATGSTTPTSSPARAAAARPRQRPHPGPLPELRAGARRPRRAACATPASTWPAAVPAASTSSRSTPRSHGGVDDARDLRERAVLRAGAATATRSTSSTRPTWSRRRASTPCSRSSRSRRRTSSSSSPPPSPTRSSAPSARARTTTRSGWCRRERLQAYLADALRRARASPVGPGVLPLVVRAGARLGPRLALGARPAHRRRRTRAGSTYATRGRPARLHRRRPARRRRRRVRRRRTARRCSASSTASIETGHDPRRFVEDLLERLRDLIVVAAVPGRAAKPCCVHAPADQLERMRGQAARFGAGRALPRRGRRQRRPHRDDAAPPSPRLQLELLCARVLLPAADDAERGIAPGSTGSSGGSR